MSSRLFQRIREELALCYNVYSFQSFLSGSGVSGVYLGTRPGWSDRSIDAVSQEFGRLAEGGLAEEELEQTKRQVKGHVMLSLESTGARLHRLVGYALFDEPFLTLDQILARIDEVTPAGVRKAASTYFRPERQLVLRLGPRD